MELSRFIHTVQFCKETQTYTYIDVNNWIVFPIRLLTYLLCKRKSLPSHRCQGHELDSSVTKIWCRSTIRPCELFLSWCKAVRPVRRIMFFDQYYALGRAKQRSHCGLYVDIHCRIVLLPLVKNNKNVQK